MADEPIQINETDAQKPVVPQVRTFAKDVAAMTGKPLEPGVVNVPAPEKPKVVERVKAPPPPPVAAMPAAPSTTESRDEVLARLRAKVSGEPAAAPERPAITAPPVLRPEAPPPGIPQVSKAAPIHTYKSDFAEHAKSQNATPLSVLAQQQDAAPSAAVLSPQKTSILPLVGSMLLVFAGIGIVYGAYYFVSNRPVAPSEIFVPSLIFADERVRLSGNGAELRTQLASLSGENLREGGVTIAYLTYATTTPEGETVERPAAGGALVEALGLTAPDILLRAVEPQSTVGVVRAGETRPFFLLRVESYERTFAGMLVWEKTMEKDLALFYPPHPLPEPVATSTSTTTAPAVPVRAPSAFVDETIANHDVRILKDAEGKTVLLYGYRDKTTLVIARSEAAFLELVARLSATRTQ